MKYFLLSAFLFCLATSSLVFAADAKDQKDQVVAPVEIHGGHAIDVFFMLGKTCPPGSHSYEGPEQIEMQKMGNSYCVFDRGYVWLEKTKELTKCPDGKPFVKPGIEVGTRVWCDMPAAEFARGGTLVMIDKEQVIVTQTSPVHPASSMAPDPTKTTVPPPKGSAPVVIPPLVTPVVAPSVTAPVGTNVPAAVPTPVAVGTNAAPPIAAPVGTNSPPPAAATSPTSTASPKTPDSTSSWFHW
jgi:hypothetical protein